MRYKLDQLENQLDTLDFESEYDYIRELREIEKIEAEINYQLKQKHDNTQGYSE